MINVDFSSNIQGIYQPVLPSGPTLCDSQASLRFWVCMLACLHRSLRHQAKDILLQFHTISNLLKKSHTWDLWLASKLKGKKEASGAFYCISLFPLSNLEPQNSGECSLFLERIFESCSGAKIHDFQNMWLSSNLKFFYIFKVLKINNICLWLCRK